MSDRHRYEDSMSERKDAAVRCRNKTERKTTEPAPGLGPWDLNCRNNEILLFDKLKGD